MTRNRAKNTNKRIDTTAPEMDRYSVLWLDDRYPEQMEFTMLAREKGVDLIPFRTLDDGFDYLEDNLQMIDAILLDTTFFMDRDEELNQDKSSSIKALSYAVDRINQLSTIKLFPYFIFTSNNDFEQDDTFKTTYGKFYRKYELQDIDQLIVDIRKGVKRQVDAIIRNKYSEVFETMTDTYLGEQHTRALFDILKSVERPEAIINNEVYFNPLRKMLEAIFVMLNRYGVIPNSCFKEPGEPNIMFCSLYLSGKEVRLGGSRFTKAPQTIYPTIIQNHAWNIVSYTNIGSHNEAARGRTSSEIAQLRASGVNSPYLLYTVTFQMLDVMLWSKEYIDRTFLLR